MSTKMDVMTGSTTSYLWLLRDLLGQGATASVYKARHKRSGELVAVKVFNATSYNRPQDVQLREFDMLRKLNHNNIIRILTVEDSNLPPPSSQKVLVMEYCAGGSLMNVLDEPANVCGLAEPEFLTVLQCVVLGMNHLRENGVVHRDIKPGNIMRQVMEDGSSVYKLTDFGAARELEDDEKFKSIYGTEEYLHPDMYARAMLRKRDEKSFGANVDLWSIGVTLYHTATGSLPFMPYGGPRKDKPTMFKITSEKPTGAIAGVQRSQGGPIKWSYELPHSCRLSQGLRQQLVPVLAGVLEGDEEKCWGFPQFFPATMNILQRVPVHLFCLQRASEHCVYIHHYSAVSVFMEEVCSQTGVPVQQQILLHLGHELPLEANMKIVNLPHTSAQRPLILLSYTPAKNSSLPVTEPESPPIPTKFDVFADYNYTKAMVGVMHQYLRMIEKLHLHRGLLLQGYYSYIMKQRGECREAMNSISKITLRLQSCFNVEQRIHALGSNADSAETTQLHQVHEHLPIYSEGIQKFENRLDQLLIEHAKLSETLANDKSIQKMELLQKKIEEVHSQYRMHRHIGKLSYNDVQIHKFDKLTMNGDIKKVKLLFRDDCLNRYRELLSAAREWSRVLQDVQIRLQDFHSFSTGLLADLELTERKQYKSLDQSIFALHSEKSLHPTGITTRDKDQMVCRMHQLKEEMEVLVRELQSNNTIIENLGATNSPEDEARPFTL